MVFNLRLIKCKISGMGDDGMYSKVLGILLATVFVISFWYIYGLYPYIQNLVSAILATLIALVGIIIYYVKLNNSDNKNERDIGTNRLLITYSYFTMALFILFFVLSVKYGGSSASDEEARSLYENYEIGKYYLVSHGNFTMVPYRIWQRMKILEMIVIPTFIIMFVWNLIHIIKTKGWKYALTGREKDSI